jgi:hypothetical protein
MPMMQDSVSVAANSVSANVLSGQLYEGVPAGAAVKLSATAAATGVRCSYICGTPLINDQAIGFQNRFPLDPDDKIMHNRVPGGRQVLTFRNTTGAAIVVFWRIDL